jgi:hypothetical protein
MQKIIWEIALKTVSEANCSEHWRTKSKRHNLQQFFVRKLFDTLESPIKLPCCVKMIRVGGRVLDEEDNLRMALKWIKDEISVCLIPELRKYYSNAKGQQCEIKGRADDDKRIKWEYGQQKGKVLGIRIEITEESD